MSNIVLYPSVFTLILVKIMLMYQVLVQIISCISLNPANQSWFSIDLAWLNKGQIKKIKKNK